MPEKDDANTRKTVQETDETQQIRQTMPEEDLPEDDSSEGGIGVNQLLKDQMDMKGRPSVRSTSRRTIVEDSYVDFKPAVPNFSLPEARLPNDSRATGSKTFYPKHRPPTPLLYIMDDNQETAQTIRVRANQIVIGRQRGDIKIPNDAHISDRHAEIRREKENGRYLWLLTDLRSTNGTYVRVAQQNIKEGDCFLLGARYFRFSKLDKRDENDELQFGLIQFANSKDEPRKIYLLRSGKNIIGDSKVDAAGEVWDDSFLDDEHVNFERDEAGQWAVFDLASHNGVWVKVNSRELTHGLSFQLGGQRFIFSQELEP